MTIRESIYNIKNDYIINFLILHRCLKLYN